MKIAFLIYHDILDDRLVKILDELKIENYSKWEKVTGKFQGADPLLGSREYPGHETIRLIPFREESVVDKLADALKEFNSKAVKHIDEVRMFVLPLEQVV